MNAGVKQLSMRTYFVKIYVKYYHVDIIFFIQNRPMNDWLKFGSCLMGHSAWNFGTTVNKLEMQLNKWTYVVLHSLTHIWRSPSLAIAPQTFNLGQFTQLPFNKRPMYVCGWATTATQPQVNKCNHTVPFSMGTQELCQVLCCLVSAFHC